MANLHTSNTNKETNLSERQKKILQFISDFLTEYGYPPTIREIGEAVDIGSTSVVNYNLNKLVKAGLLERAPEVSRGLRLVKSIDEVREMPVITAEDIYRLPLVGSIVASAPVELPGDDFGYYYDSEDMIEVPAYLLGNRAGETDVYALRVNGDSMIDALVGDKDIVVLRRQSTARNGEMVAVWLTNTHQTTLKYFFQEGTQVRLQPANTTMDPIYVDARHVQIQGKVLAVLRQVL